MLNSADYARELKTGYGSGVRAIIYFFAMVPATVFMGLVGLTISTSTGIPNPIVAFSESVDNKFLVVITLLFIIFAQLTTNLLSNVIPPTYALMDTFKLSHRASAVIVSILAIFTFPWILASDSSTYGINIFVSVYTAFIGPIAAILLVDYFVIRKGKIDMKVLYDDNGPFRGFNVATIIALFIGAGIGLLSKDLNIIASFLPTCILYYVLATKMSCTKRFLVGTEFENK